MVDKLRIKAIYDDFIANVNLTDEQILIIDLLLKRESYIKIAGIIGVSERTIGYEVKRIKKLYEDYCKTQLSKAIILTE